MNKNYFRQTDLAPGGVAVTDPVAQAAALHYFGFEATQIELQNMGTGRVLVSFGLAHDAGLGAATAPPPPQPAVHAAIEPGQALAFPDATRSHVLVWRDPAAPPPAGAENVRVRAWA